MASHAFWSAASHIGSPNSAHSFPVVVPAVIDEPSLSPRVVPSLPLVLGSELPELASVDDPLLLLVEPVLVVASVVPDELASVSADVVEPPPSSPHPVSATAVTARSFGMDSLRFV